MPMYRLHDMPEMPESPEDSVGTSSPIITPLVRRSGSSSSTPIVSPTTTLAEEAIAAENLAARAAAATTAAAETSATVVAATAAAPAAAAAQAKEEKMADDEEVIKKIFVRVVPGKKPRSISSGLGVWMDQSKIAGKRVRRGRLGKKDYIPAATWSRWVSDWNTTAALELSRKKSNARMGSNKKCSKHSEGSIIASEHAKLFEIKHKRKANAIELFDLLHRRKGDKGFVDDKSASISATFKARKIELSRQADESTVPNDDEIYLEIVGGENQVGDVYGIGLQSSSLLNSGSIVNSGSSAYERDPKIVTSSMVTEIVQQLFTNYEERNEECVGQRKEKEVEARLTSVQAMLLQVQDLLARFPTIPDTGYN